MVYCGHMVGWIMPLGMEVRLGPGHTVLDGDPAPPTAPAIFGPCLLWPTAGLIKMPPGTEVGLGPADIVLGAQQPPTHFSAHVYCDQTVAHLSNG